MGCATFLTPYDVEMIAANLSASEVDMTWHPLNRTSTELNFLPGLLLLIHRDLPRILLLLIDRDLPLLLLLLLLVQIG
jgi:hypothetical protein